MSAVICWRPVKGGKSLNVASPSKFRKTLAQAFGGSERTFSPDDIPVLNGMAAVYDGGGDPANPYLELIEAIEKHGKVELYVGC